MAESPLLDCLHQLHDLLLQERDCAKQLDMDGLHRAIEAKEALLAAMPDVNDPQTDPQVRTLAAKVAEANRQNAYFFWASLNWVREHMSFYSDQLAAKSYGHKGASVSTSYGGNLLSGRI